MADILDGKIVRDKIKEELKEKFKAFSVRPKLVIFQIGDREDSNIYIKHKVLFGEDIGVTVDTIKLDENITEADLANKIDKVNRDDSVGGIIVQLPLPPHISKHIINSIDPKKDVDALTDFHKNQFFVHGKSAVIPATARAVFNLLNFYNIDVANKSVAVLGRSELVGHPTAVMLRSLGAKVSVVHSKTVNPEDICRHSDILVVAIGKPLFIDSKYINKSKGQVIIDIGIHKVDGKVVGDVDFNDVFPLVFAISPVPGGVGPLTVASLFQNLYDLLILNS
jgi:methylenetetrahydrofolate dehydrogenase (NADP+)/methenyltetrahydrofolate cyclohydrolase